MRRIPTLLFPSGVIVSLLLFAQPSWARTNDAHPRPSTQLDAHSPVLSVPQSFVDSLNDSTAGSSGIGSGAGDIVARTAEFGVNLANDFTTQLMGTVSLPRTHPKGFVLGASGIIALILTDHSTLDALAPLDELQEHGLDHRAQSYSEFGRPPTIVPVVLGLGAVGIVFDSHRERETAIMLVEALITSQVWTDAIKTLSGRERPREAEGTYARWEGPPFLRGNDANTGLRSFPSGHSSGAWAVATVLAKQYPRKGVPIVTYTAAGLMSYSRMVVRAHWLSDVVVAGLIGYGCARQVVASHRQREAEHEQRNLELGVNVSPAYTGFRLTVRF